MDRMRANMKNGSVAYVMPAGFRRSMQTPELRQIIERADPSGNGNPNPNSNPRPNPNSNPTTNPNTNPSPNPSPKPQP
jgi:hypothetical protein